MKMTDLELREKASEIVTQLRDKTIPDETILLQIKEEPELVHTKCLAGTNLFLEAVRWDRFPVAQALSDMGADIHWTCNASIFNGNALNVARSPQDADALLALGIEIEKNLSLSISKPFKNPAIMAACHNDAPMLLYWLKKQKEIFADNPDYISELFYATIEVVSIMNQYNMLSCIITNAELFDILKKVYSEVDNTKSINLYLSTLRQINDRNLDTRKKELRTILNTKKKELSSKT